MDRSAPKSVGPENRFSMIIFAPGLVSARPADDHVRSRLADHPDPPTLAQTHGLEEPGRVTGPQNCRPAPHRPQGGLQTARAAPHTPERPRRHLGREPTAIEDGRPIGTAKTAKKNSWKPLKRQKTGKP